MDTRYRVDTIGGNTGFKLVFGDSLLPKGISLNDDDLRKASGEQATELLRIIVQELRELPLPQDATLVMCANEHTLEATLQRASDDPRVPASLRHLIVNTVDLARLDMLDDYRKEVIDIVKRAITQCGGTPTWTHNTGFIGLGTYA